jgi:multiple sugar transport system permease protein/sn-glycerol 3-phosphate transport system permease protein
VTIDVAPPGARATSGQRHVYDVQWRPYAYLLPLIILVGLFTYWPLIQTFYLSFVLLNPGAAPSHVGLANYLGVFDHSQFKDAAWNSVVYILAAIPLKVLLPIPIAFFLWAMLPRLSALYKTILFVPTLLSFVVVAILWVWMLNPVAGFANTLLKPFGVTLPPLISRSETAIYVIIAVSTWKVLGFNVLLYLAGLASISRDLIEAMRVDGAGEGVIFRMLIVPLLSPTILFVLISTIVFAVQQVFTPIDVMTQGGPANATTNLFYIAYQYTFESFNIGFASAAVALLFFGIGALMLLKLAIVERHVHYG